MLHNAKIIMLQYTSLRPRWGAPPPNARHPAKSTQVRGLNPNSPFLLFTGGGAVENVKDYHDVKRAARNGVDSSDWISSVLRSLGETWKLPECPMGSNPASAFASHKPDWLTHRAVRLTAPVRSGARHRAQRPPGSESSTCPTQLRRLPPRKVGRWRDRSNGRGSFPPLCP